MALTKLNFSGQPTLPVSSFPTDSVLQVKENTAQTEAALTTTSYSATSTTVQITPSSSTSKILVMGRMPFQTASSGMISFSLFRDSTNLGNNDFGRIYIPSTDVEGTVIFEDSPSTTSQITYSIQAKVSSGTHYININNAMSTIVAMEIKG